MSLSLSLHVTELLASKICHDLISPVGAVANGVEFMEEMGPDAGAEATDLIKFSALQASAKLQAYRMAYGSGGSDTSIKPENVHAIFEKMVVQDGKVTLEWDPHAPIGPAERPAGFCKLLMCGLLLALDSLPKGGEIRVEAYNDDAVQFIASGTDAHFKHPQALSGEIHESVLEPKNIHAYISCKIAEHYNFQLPLNSEDNDSVCFLLSFQG